jgi:membrane protease YdiL (CAAX protease family)
MRWWIAATLMHLAAAYVVLVAPTMGARAYRALQARLAGGDSEARLRYYRTVVVRQAITAAAVASIWLAGGLPAWRLGLTVPDAEWLALTGLLLAAIALSIVLFRRTGDFMLQKLVRLAGAILPRSTAERRWFVAVSVGAGVSEELVFRGFLFYYIATFLPETGLPGLILLSSVVFGYCHIYQGWQGALLTGIIGLVFALLYAESGCLWLPMLVHAAVDARIPMILTPKRLASLGVQSS